MLFVVSATVADLARDLLDIDSSPAASIKVEAGKWGLRALTF
jgi:hypothetical protein